MKSFHSSGSYFPVGAIMQTCSLEEGHLLLIPPEKKCEWKRKGIIAE